jgi:hypothetical protein
VRLLLGGHAWHAVCGRHRRRQELNGQDVAVAALDHGAIRVVEEDLEINMAVVRRRQQNKSGYRRVKKQTVPCTSETQKTNGCGSITVYRNCSCIPHGVMALCRYQSRGTNKGCDMGIKCGQGSIKTLALDHYQYLAVFAD